MPSVAEILLRYREEFANVPDEAKRKLLDVGKTAKRSMGEAKDAADILKDSFGVQLPRELTKLISQSKLLGPALAASFNVAAVVGFVAAAQQLPEIFNKISAAVTGWNDAAKKAYDDFLSQNQKAVDSAEKFRLKMTEIQKGTSASLKQQVEDLQKASEQLQRAAVAARKPTEETFGQALIRSSTFGLVNPAGNNAEADRLQNLANERAKEFLEAQRALAIQQLEDDKKANDERIKKADDALKQIHQLILRGQEELGRDLAESLKAGTFGMDQASKDYLNLLDERIKFAEEKTKELDFWQSQLLDFRNRTANGGESVKEGLEEADRRAKKIGDTMKESAKATQQAYKEAFDSVKQTANRAFLDIFNSTHGLFSGLASAIKGIFRTLASEILSTLTAQLFTPLIQSIGNALGQRLGLSSLGGSLGGLLGGTAGSSAAAGGAGAAGGAAATGGLTLAKVGAFATNPITIGVAAAAVGAIAWLKSQAHHEASTFVQNFQNPFGAGLASIVDAFNAQKNAGTLTAAGGQSAINQVQSLWNQFTTEAEKFAAGGSDEARVVSQAHKTLDPLLEQILRDMHDALQALPGGAKAQPQKAEITIQLDRKTVGRIVLEDINILLRGQGYVLQAAR